MSEAGPEHNYTPLTIESELKSCIFLYNLSKKIYNTEKYYYFNYEIQRRMFLYAFSVP